MVTLNGTKRQSMPVFHIAMDSLDGKMRERIEVTGSKMPEFATVRRPDMNELKFKYEHAQDKKFYVRPGDEYKIDIILGDSTYCKIKTEDIYKGNPGEPIVEGTTFGWVIHGGDDHATDQCMCMREICDYEKLYSLDVLGVQDRGENDQLDVLKEFKDDITRREDGRYEVRVPWIPGSTLESTNEQPSRRRLQNVNKKLIQNPELKKEYEKIIEDQMRDGIIETVPEQPSGERTFYMPHKPVVRDSATTTKVRMVFDASAKPHHLANSVNDCMHTGPPLQPLLWDILIRARMAPFLLLGTLRRRSSKSAWGKKIETLFVSYLTLMIRRSVFDSQGYHLELKLVPLCLQPHCNTTMIANRRISTRLFRCLEETHMWTIWWRQQTMLGVWGSSKKKQPRS